MRQQIQAGISQSSACAESYFFISFWNEGPKVLGTYFSRGFRIKSRISPSPLSSPPTTGERIKERGHVSNGDRLCPKLLYL